MSVSPQAFLPFCHTECISHKHGTSYCSKSSRNSQTTVGRAGVDQKLWQLHLQTHFTKARVKKKKTTPCPQSVHRHFRRHNPMPIRIRDDPNGDGTNRDQVTAEASARPSDEANPSLIRRPNVQHYLCTPLMAICLLRSAKLEEVCPPPSWLALPFAAPLAPSDVPHQHTSAKIDDSVQACGVI